jgi:hypothetical protein
MLRTLCTRRDRRLSCATQAVAVSRHHTIQGSKAMTDVPPDRLAMDPRSKFHDADVLARGVGIRFKGEEKTNVEEYCVSEGWVRLPVGKSLDRRGNAMTIKVSGDVVPYFLDQK